MNKFPYLDVYPLFSIDDLINTVFKYIFFSTVDPRSNYHFVPLHPKEKIHTAFEADGQLFQLKGLCLGLTNNVVCFQRIIESLICVNNLEDMFGYLDEITVCRRAKEKHD